MVSAIAIRGERLVLARVRASGRDPKAIQNDALNIVEIDADERIMAAITFDLDDFDAAIAELDARYLAGEAAAYAQTWSVVMRTVHCNQPARTLRYDSRLGQYRSPSGRNIRAR